jgi:hypothetical protein
MASSYNVLDLIRIQTMVNMLSNEASWLYVARPQNIDKIESALAVALKALGGLRLVETFSCPKGFCIEYGRCVNCVEGKRPPKSKPLPEAATLHTGERKHQVARKVGVQSPDRSRRRHA